MELASLWVEFIKKHWVTFIKTHRSFWVMIVDVSGPTGSTLTRADRVYFWLYRFKNK